MQFDFIFALKEIELINIYLVISVVSKFGALLKVILKNIIKNNIKYEELYGHKI